MYCFSLDVIDDPRCISVITSDCFVGNEVLKNIFNGLIKKNDHLINVKVSK